MVDVLYVVDVGSIETTVGDWAAPLYVEVVAELILQLTDLIKVGGSHVIIQIGVVIVTPVIGFKILQNNCVFPDTPPPVTLVEELEGVSIVQTLPVVCHK